MKVLITIALLINVLLIIAYTLYIRVSEKREIAKLKIQVEERIKRILDLCKELEE